MDNENTDQKHKIRRECYVFIDDVFYERNAGCVHAV